MLSRLLFGCLTLALVVGSALTQGVHALQGRVVMPSGTAPSTQVKVTLSYNGMRVYETFTDLSGRFYFASLRAGTYQLAAEGDLQTFETTTVNAEVGTMGRAPQTFTQNIQLRPRQGAPAVKAGLVPVEEIDPATPEVARREYEKGTKDANNNNPDAAVKHLTKAIVAYPNFYAAHAAIAEQFDKLKKYDEAVAAYLKAIELKPDRALAHAGLGVTLVKQKKYAEAIPSLRHSIELDKSYYGPYLFLGLAEMMTGDYASAEANLLRAYDLGKPALARIYLANLYDLKGEPTKAIDHLQAFLKENPESPNSRQIREVIEKLRKQTAAKK